MPVTIEKISHTFKKGTPWERRALNEVSFSLEQAEILGISGPTGSGKSTLLSLMAGLLPLQQGRILLDDIKLNRGHKLSSQHKTSPIAMVGQMPEKQLFELTVFKDIAFGPSNQGVDKAELQLRVKAAMQAVGLDYHTFKERAPLSLSTGEKRRVAIAGILALDPDYLLLDEPGAGLDWEGRRVLFEQLLALRSQGKGIVMVSHRLEELMMVCDRLLIMEAGSIRYLGETLEVVERMEAEQSGQGLTPAREVLKQLEARGWSINTRIREPEQAAAEIIKSLKGPDNNGQ